MTDVAGRFSYLSAAGLLAGTIAIFNAGSPANAGATTQACGWLDPQAAAKFSSLAAECALAPAAIPAGQADESAFDSMDLPVDPPAARPVSVSVPFGNFVRTTRVRRAVPTRFASPLFVPGPSGLIAAVAASHRIDPLLLGAIVARESAGRADAVSAKGAVGLMQVMPATGRALGVTDPAQLRDPATSLVAGATYLKQMQARFGGDLALTLAAYNAGPGAVARHRGVPPYAETRGYVAAILARYRAARAGATMAAGR